MRARPGGAAAREALPGPGGGTGRDGTESRAAMGKLLVLALVGIAAALVAERLLAFRWVSGVSELRVPVPGGRDGAEATPGCGAEPGGGGGRCPPDLGHNLANTCPCIGAVSARGEGFFIIITLIALNIIKGTLFSPEKI